ncbi:MAG: hypothetical protein J0I06_19775 [Planctomycetes bacterium]|nr:hypothetical protein [Planctomycetota bacterium]
MPTHTVLRAAAGLLFLLTVGCGGTDDARPKVSGKATYNGQPLANKTLMLTLEDGASQSLHVGPDGTFTGEVPKPGTYKVVIAESMAVMEGVEKARKDGPKIAAKYRSAATSDVTVNVDRGSNEKLIEFKD